MLNILMIGDIVGSSGILAVKKILPRLYEKYNLDMVIANGENAAGGNGITLDIVDELFSYDIHVITMGNHVWDKKEILKFIDSQEYLIRPANYPQGTPGRGYTIVKLKNDIKIGIINLSGVIYLQPLIPPFTIIDEIINEVKKLCSIIVVDFHAEATSEKVAMGWYLDGKVNAVFGTHTHVQTADERILPKGAAYITDVGMTGPRDSVLGVKKELVIDKFKNFMPVRFETAKGVSQLNGVIITIDSINNETISIRRIQEII